MDVSRPQDENTHVESMDYVQGGIYSIIPFVKPSNSLKNKLLVYYISFNFGLTIFRQRSE